MNKRQYCESRESIAYYSGLNGLEIKGIEYGIDDYIYCVSGAWGRRESVPPLQDTVYPERGGVFPGVWV